MLNMALYIESFEEYVNTNQSIQMLFPSLKNISAIKEKIIALEYFERAYEETLKQDNNNEGIENFARLKKLKKYLNDDKTWEQWALKIDPKYLAIFQQIKELWFSQEYFAILPARVLLLSYEILEELEAHCNRVVKTIESQGNRCHENIKKYIQNLSLYIFERKKPLLEAIKVRVAYANEVFQPEIDSPFGYIRECVIAAGINDPEIGNVEDCYTLDNNEKYVFYNKLFNKNNNRHNIKNLSMLKSSWWNIWHPSQKFTDEFLESQQFLLAKLNAIEQDEKIGFDKLSHLHADVQKVQAEIATQLKKMNFLFYWRRRQFLFQWMKMYQGQQCRVESMMLQQCEKMNTKINELTIKNSVLENHISRYVKEIEILKKQEGSPKPLLSNNIKQSRLLFQEKLYQNMTDENVTKKIKSSKLTDFFDKKGAALENKKGCLFMSLDYK